MRKNYIIEDTKTFRSNRIYFDEINQDFGDWVNYSVVYNSAKMMTYNLLYNINTSKMKASQYNHDTDTCIKIPLSQRGKIVGGHWVQRDLYSAYVVQNRKDSESVDRDKCINGFDNFIKIQTKIINNLKKRGDDLPKCMGI